MRSLITHIVCILLIQSVSFAQTDTSKTLQELTVRGFETQKTKLQTPAAVSSVSYQEIQRYGNSNPLPVLNAQAGIRMEERSPGSFRLAIRGSSLRSPFGVRNVKVYWSGIPMSDANGTTYLNQADFNSLGSVEILRGPASSIFGAGYGGVVNLNLRNADAGHRFFTGFQIGDYQTFNTNVGYDYGSEKVNISLTNSSVNSEGYRSHSNQKANRTSLNISYFPSAKHSINFSQLISNIDYRTPGGLTLAQMEASRTASRPATAALPSAEEQNAGIQQNLTLFGLSHIWKFNSLTRLSTTLFGSGSKLENPFITSYEDRKENTFGYRTVASRNWHKLSFYAGSEGIFTSSEFDVKQNLAGVRGSAMYFTDLKSTQLTHFIQVRYLLPLNIEITGGLSHNFQQYINTTTTPYDAPLFVKEKPSVPWTPRIALLKEINQKMSAYYSWSNGYSAPTAQEITANFENSRNTRLTGEEGLSHEAGFKSVWNSIFRTELAVYHQTVKNALVRNVLENGGEYFENTGKVIQQGIELSNELTLRRNDKFIRLAVFNLNWVLNRYTFADYLNEGVNLDGKTLPGTSRTNLYFAGRIVQKNGIYLNADFNYLTKAPLNNLNTAFADPIFLSTLRLGWNYPIGKNVSINMYGGVENLLNREYSLGYDFNAFGGRFFNPSPKRNLNAGTQLQFRL